MEQILIACGNVDLLRKIAGDLPTGRFKPIATKTGAGIAAKIAPRNVRLAIVYEALADGHGAALCNELRQTPSPPAILYLCSATPPNAGPFEVALKYPVPGPVLRNAIKRLAPPADTGHDMAAWQSFFAEIQQRLSAMPQQSYFGVLGLPDGAPHDHIVGSYDQFSLRYHPDRYAQYRTEPWGADVYDATNQLYQVVVEAFSVLSDRRLRKAYERGLQEGTLRMDPNVAAQAQGASEQLENLAQTKQGKKFLKLAKGDIARKEWASALQNLQFAASMEDEIPALNDKIAEVKAKLGGG